MNHDLTRTITRIQQMEYYFDTASDALRQGIPAGQPLLQALLRALERYQSSGLWLHDYQLDEQGLLPTDLKRGVLSEDGLYNLLCDTLYAIS
ncbi:MAG: DUF4298 domain-containing protein [Firmicutes bacterium]|nr:DUF4298 domain-containing protein [Bacillota bacterium]